MPIANFIPELWAAAVQVPHDQALVFNQPAIANRDFEGTLRQQGDTVHVTTVDDPTVSAYDKNTDIVIEDLNDDRISLVVDQGEYFAFRVNDIDAVQAAGNFQLPALQRAGWKLAAEAEEFSASQFVLPATGVNAGGPVAANRLGGVTVTSGRPEDATAGQISAYQVLVKLREILDKQSVPLPGRYVVVNPEFVSCLLMDSRYTDMSASGSSDALLQGQVGRATGFNVLVSNLLPKTGAASTICAGVPAALTYVNQISNVETYRDQTRFADVVRGLNIYGAKIFRREDVATATVTIAAPAPGSGD